VAVAGALTQVQVNKMAVAVVLEVVAEMDLA